MKKTKKTADIYLKVSNQKNANRQIKQTVNSVVYTQNGTMLTPKNKNNSNDNSNDNRIEMENRASEEMNNND